MLAVSGERAGGGQAAAEVLRAWLIPAASGAGGAAGWLDHDGSGSGEGLDRAGIFRVAAARAVHPVRGTVDIGGGYVLGAHDDGLIAMPGVARRLAGITWRRVRGLGLAVGWLAAR